jgi:hypothetical protein
MVVGATGTVFGATAVEVMGIAYGWEFGIAYGGYWPYWSGYYGSHCDPFNCPYPYHYPAVGFGIAIGGYGRYDGRWRHFGPR